MATIETGRTSADIAGFIRSGVLTGKYATGKFLPPTREFGEQYGVSPETVRRALKVLEQEELLESIPRHGFRVAGSGGMLSASCPVAYVTYFAEDLSNAHPVNWALSTALQTSAAQRGWTVLGAHSGEKDLARLTEQLLAARVWGIVLDSVDPEILRGVAAAELPVVMTNSWFENADIDVDAVVQDNYRGGFQAAQHLIEEGAEQIAWVGPVGKYSASRERFAGVVAGLAARGRRLAADMVIDTSTEGSRDRLTELLSRKDRPDGACAFWKGVADQLKKSAEELGLRIGTDLRVVGWAVEEFWEIEHASTYSGMNLPPAVVWSAADMAEAALDRLEARRRGQVNKSVRISVPTRIRGK
jgi:LacI family transcriptional regulator, galactose operon repressor